MASSKVERLRMLLDEHEIPPSLREPVSNETPDGANTNENAESSEGTFVNPALNDMMSIKVGCSADRSMPFCPLHAISRFPSKYIRDKELSELVANQFFDDQAFWNRRWDVYYVWPVTSTAPFSPKPLFLIPAEDVENFFREINNAIEEASLSVMRRHTDEKQDEGLRIVFDFEHPRLRPRFLGEHYRPISEPPRVEPMSTEEVNAFKKKVEKGAELSKHKASKAQRQRQRVSKQQEWKNNLKQTERFLGLRPAEEPKLSYADRIPYPGAENTPLSWEEWQISEDARIHPKPIPATDPALPPQYPLEDEVVIICIDVECYERNRKKITEIGISTLDTLEIKHIPPGLNGKNWFEKIKSRHFRIKENAHLINGDFCEDNSGRFAKEFGKSEFISIDDAPQEIAKCFRPPYPETPSTTALPTPERPAKRTLVVAGHDIINDLRFLEFLGYDVTNLSTLHARHPIIDTQSLYRALHRQHEAPKLSIMLHELGIEAWHLHNAGNDAAYTLRGLLGLCVRSAVERGSKVAKKRWEERKQATIVEAAKTAVERAIEQTGGWSSEEDEEGGVPLRAR